MITDAGQFLRSIGVEVDVSRLDAPLVRALATHFRENTDLRRECDAMRLRQHDQGLEVAALEVYPLVKSFPSNIGGWVGGCLRVESGLEWVGGLEVVG